MSLGRRTAGGGHNGLIRTRRLDNLPAQPTPLLGREQEVRAAREWLLRDDVRLLTLTGPGGSGKTRLALALAEGLLGTFADGIWLVDLTPLRDPSLVISAIAHVLGLRESGARPGLERLVDHLRKRRALLVLDNCEQVLGAAPQIAELLGACRHVKVLATSREPLHLRWEHELPVAPLAVPDLGYLPDLEALARVPSVALFLERAQAVAPELALTEENAPAVAEICARLDGLPLAIELAAARAKLLPPRVLLRRLVGAAGETSLGLLTGGGRDGPARHRTLRDAVAWSYALLEPAEQALFRRLAVFVGGWTLEAAEAVCDDAVDLIASLVDKSLVRWEAQADGEPRPRMLETLREYAAEQLAASPDEAADARDRHVAHYVELAEAAEPHLEGPAQGVWLEHLDRERGNVCAALRRLRECGDAERGLRLGAALWRFWWARSDAPEARERIEGILALAAASPPSAARARALHGAGVLARELGDYPAARALMEESLTIARRLGERHVVADVLDSLGWLLQLQGDSRGARPHLREALETFGQLGYRWGLATTLHRLGYVAFAEGDHAGALPLYRQSLEVARQAGYRRIVADVLFSIGVSAHVARDLAGARRSYEESSTIHRALGQRHLLIVTHSLLGHAAAMQGDVLIARTLYRESLLAARETGNRRRLAFTLSAVATLVVQHEPERALRFDAVGRTAAEAMGAVLAPPVRELWDGQLDRARAALGEERAAVATVDGALALEEAVEEALVWLAGPADVSRADGRSGAGGLRLPDGGHTSDGSPTRPVAGGPAIETLTCREREVAALIAGGATNRRIAEILVISPHTAERHVERILAKLGCGARAEVAAWAVRQGLAPLRTGERDAA